MSSKQCDSLLCQNWVGSKQPNQGMKKVSISLYIDIEGSLNHALQSALYITSIFNFPPQNDPLQAWALVHLGFSNESDKNLWSEYKIEEFFWREIAVQLHRITLYLTQK